MRTSIVCGVMLFTAVLAAQKPTTQGHPELKDSSWHLPSLTTVSQEPLDHLPFESVDDLVAYADVILVGRFVNARSEVAKGAPEADGNYVIQQHTLLRFQVHEVIKSDRHLPLATQGRLFEIADGGDGEYDLKTLTVVRASTESLAFKPGRLYLVYGEWSPRFDRYMSMYNTSSVVDVTNDEAKPFSRGKFKAKRSDELLRVVREKAAKAQARK